MTDPGWIDMNILWVVNSVIENISSKIIKLNPAYKKMLLKSSGLWL